MKKDAASDGGSNFEKIKRANYANCLKKLKAGKTLTSAEMKSVEDAQTDDKTEYVKTLSALANRCRVTRVTLRKFLRMDEAPKEIEGKGFAVDAVKRFILSKSKRGDVAGKMDDSVDDLRKWETFERARRAHLRNERDVGAMIPKSHHLSIISGMVSECQRVLGALPQKMAPEVVGLTVPEAEIRLTHAINEALVALKTGNG